MIPLFATAWLCRSYCVQCYIHHIYFKVHYGVLQQIAMISRSIPCPSIKMATNQCNSSMHPQLFPCRRVLVQSSLDQKPHKILYIFTSSIIVYLPLPFTLVPSPFFFLNFFGSNFFFSKHFLSVFDFSNLSNSSNI